MNRKTAHLARWAACGLLLGWNLSAVTSTLAQALPANQAEAATPVSVWHAAPEHKPANSKPVEQPNASKPWQAAGPATPVLLVPTTDPRWSVKSDTVTSNATPTITPNEVGHVPHAPANP